VYPVAGAIMIASAVVVSGLVRATRPNP
jgi:hypothetical protein